MLCYLLKANAWSGKIVLLRQEVIICQIAASREANSMKYSGCKKINIGLFVMNEMVRCTVSDDGGGCASFKDGMGISGMRQRIRNAGGIISFETEAGFTVNMLLPLGKQ